MVARRTATTVMMWTVPALLLLQWSSRTMLCEAAAFGPSSFGHRPTHSKLKVLDAPSLFDALHTLPSLSSVLTSDTDAATISGAVSDVATTNNSVKEAAADGTTSYSKASYYTTLGLYALSFPGIWSQVTRSTSAKVKRKTYVTAGENSEGGKVLRQQAAEIMAYMKANNYEVVDAGEVIKFRGLVQRSTSQAFFLTFCTALGLASLALVLQIQFQDFALPVVGGSPNWFYLTLLSPYAGIYYWRSGDRVDDVTVRLASNDDETENEIIVEGNEDELERMWRSLDWNEKGMVKIQPILKKP